MHAFTDEETRLLDQVAGAARRTWRRRRFRSRLRDLGRRVASQVNWIWTGLLKSLHESRSRSAARVIERYRHLIQDDQCSGHADREMGPSIRAEQ
jgi:hypothetical protein